jgi:DNA polymerase III alpha subunit
MTCAQIASELAPYAQQIVPNVQAYGATSQQLYGQSKQLQQQRKVEHAAVETLATAGAVDPTGASKKAYELALMAQMAKEKAENDALANSPLAQQNRAQGEQLAAQGQQMQANGRVQRLMQLGQEKRCDKQ